MSLSAATRTRGGRAGKAEAERTDEQRFGDAIAGSLHPDRKRAYNAELIRRLHGTEEE